MFDTHVHLQHPKYAGDLSAVLNRAVASGVTAAIVPGTNLEDSTAAVAFAAMRARSPLALYAAVGIHPTEANDLTAETWLALGALAEAPCVVAIGEIGLDYYWPKVSDRGWVCADPETQRQALGRQLALASELDLPVVIHDRDAHRDTLDLVQAWKARDPRARGTLHAYAAGSEFMDEVMALGFHIGLDGPVTFRNAVDLRAVARRVPLGQMLLETDGPYLTPAPHRGQRNEPAYLIYIAERIAELRGVAVEEIAAATTDNARVLFGL